MAGVTIREKRLGIHSEDLGVKQLFDRELAVVIYPNGDRGVAVGDNDNGYILLATKTGINTSFTSSDGKSIQSEGGLITNISPIDFIESQMYDLTT